MSKELPGLRAREVVRALEKAGFSRWRQKGSHLTMFREADRRALTIPIHFSKTVPNGTLRAIIKQAGLSPEEFLRNL
jgi:predicted RNA binding protein YcfA (HicA-like mRNA interferase family)